MKNPVYEQIQARKVKARLRMLQHAQRISGNVSQTCRFFGVSRPLFYIWKERYEKHGVANPPHSGGASLRRRSSQSLSATALSRLRFADDHSEDLSSSSRWPRFAEEVSSGPKPPDAPLQVPGRSVQLDVKFVPRVGRARQRFYQFTAIDEATRFRVLRIYDHDNTKTAIDFLREVQDHFPFAIQKIQTDNGSSFGPQFTWHLSDLRISHRHIPPGCPEVNGKVKRSHKTDSEEFYQGRHFKHKRDLARKLKRWETVYNEDRPHLALKGKTPGERLRELTQSSGTAKDLS